MRTLWTRRGISIYVAWYDMWFGVYVDTNTKRIYFQPLPFIGIKVFYG